MIRAKELMIEFEFNGKEKWLNLKFKDFLCPLLLSCCVLNSVFDIIIMIALHNRVLNVRNLMRLRLDNSLLFVS